MTTPTRLNDDVEQRKRPLGCEPVAREKIRLREWTSRSACRMIGFHACPNPAGGREKIT
jgi:hypothetical protein